jgi:hypothetical protein
MLAEVLSWAVIALPLILILTLSSVVVTRRAHRVERGRRARQLDAVYTAQERRRRGE